MERHVPAVMAAITATLLLSSPRQAIAQFITPVRETDNGGSVLQFGGIGSVSATDLEKLASSASAQITILARPSRWAELYGSFNRGAGLTKIDSDSFDVSGLLYPEAANASFMGQAEIGPYFKATTGGVPARIDLTLFGNFASRKNLVTQDMRDREFTAGSTSAGLKFSWAAYPPENTIRIVVGTGYSRIFIANTDLDDARLALGRPQLPRTFSGIRTVVAAQVNALVVEAQFPNMSAKSKVAEDGLTGFQSVVRFYVVGKFLSFGSHQ